MARPRATRAVSAVRVAAHRQVSEKKSLTLSALDLDLGEVVGIDHALHGNTRGMFLRIETPHRLGMPMIYTGAEVNLDIPGTLAGRWTVDLVVYKAARVWVLPLAQTTGCSRMIALTLRRVFEWTEHC